MGSSGHLSHLIEDWELTFADLKDVISAAADARLESVTEKTDGTELLFSWNEELGQVRGARNSTDIKNGGLGAREFAARFSSKGGLEIALTSAIGVLDRALAAVPPAVRVRLFGDTAERWYSAEIMHSAWQRTIRYAGNNIVFHEQPVFHVDHASGKVTREGGLAGAELSKWIKDLRSGVNDPQWRLHPWAEIQLKKLTDGTIVAQALSRLDAAMSETGLHDDDTLASYVKERLASLLDDVTGLTLPDDVHAAVVARLAGLPGAPTLNAIKKMAPDMYEHVKAAVGQEKKLVELALDPLESAMREFAVGLLRGVGSLFNDNPDAEVRRLQAATAKALNALERSDDPAAKTLFATMKGRLERLEDINPIEGIVFMYKGKPYKLTGAFAPMNRVLSLFTFTLGGKLDEARARLTEGGHGFDAVQSVRLSVLKETWPEIERALRRVGVTRIESIGTTWKKDPMGDVDLAVTYEPGRDALMAALLPEFGAGALRKVGGNIVSVAFPTVSSGRPTGEFVQVDVMVGDVDYLTWARYGPSPDRGHAEYSAVKGVVRNMLLNVIAEHVSGRVFPGRQTALDRERYVVDFDRGLFRVVQTKRRPGSEKPLASWKTLERELVASRPDEVVAVLLSGKHDATKYRRFEDLVDALKRSPLFRNDLTALVDGLVEKMHLYVDEGRDFGASFEEVEGAVRKAFAR